MQHSSGFDPDDISPEEISEGIQNLSLKESIESGIPNPGLPGPLPAGEKIAWQGVPNWRNLARHMFYTRWISGYFGIIALVVGTKRIYGGGHASDAIAAGIPIIFFGILTVGILSLLAWIGARAAIYTITNYRIIMRVGAAFSKSIDIPFGVIETVVSKNLQGGFSNISIELKSGNRIPYFFIWPHSRPWHFRDAQPMLRAVKNGEEVSQVLVTCLNEFAERSSRDDSPITASNQNQIKAEETNKDPETFTGVRSKKQTGGRERIIVSSALGLIAAAILLVFASGYFDVGPSTKRTSGPTTIIEIKVQQIGQDNVSIIDVATNMTIVKLPPGQEGLVGNAIRGLRRIRRQEKLSISDRYQLVEWKDNRITLSDMDLDRHIPLSSFSPPRASAAAKMQQYLLDKRALD